MKKRSMETYRGWIVFFLCMLLLAAVVFSHFLFSANERSFELLPRTSQERLTWIFVTRNGDGGTDGLSVFPSESELEALAGTPVKRVFCTADKFLNMSAADMPMDVVTSCYMDSKIKRFETSGKFLRLQDLLEEELPGFILQTELVEWCGNIKGDVYAYPHTRTITGVDEESGAGVAMLAKKDLLQKYGIDKSSLNSKEGVLAALKIIRKKESRIASSYFDLISLQQMFGAREKGEDGQWQEPFFQEETLEAIQYMNQLYRERVLTQEVFTLTGDGMLSHLSKGDFFLAATKDLYDLLCTLPEDSPVWEQYEVVGPIAPDSGKSFAFSGNYGEQFASTMFVADSGYRTNMARLFAEFTMQNMELQPSQKEALQEAGISSAPTGSAVRSGNARLEPFDRYAEPVIHYEILFSHYADTRLAEINERIQNYKDSQVIKMVLNLDPGEVERVYRETVREIENDGYDLVLKWKQSKYQRALQISEQRLEGTQ